MNCLNELESIILELKRIASRRRFMRHRILDIADQLNHVADWIYWAHEKNTRIINIDDDLFDALDDLEVVIHYKKFMRRECWNVYHRIRSVKHHAYNVFVNSEIDRDDYWLTSVYGCHKMVVR